MRTHGESGGPGDGVSAVATEPAMLDVLQGFVHELRLAGLPVSMTENLDAMRAVEYVPLDDRDAFKTALGATLVKHHGHHKVFDTVFEVYFSIFSPGVDGRRRRRARRRRAGRLRPAPRRDGRRRRDGPALERGARADAPRRADAHGHRADARAGGRGRRPLRGHGARPAGRRRVLPLPHAAAARRRRVSSPR